jgi:Tol biopolymer transport system component
VIQSRVCILLCLSVFLAACSSDTRKSGEYRIALVPEMAGQHGIFLINSDQTGGKLITTDETAQLRPSSWSPDGKKIAFFAARDEDSTIRKKYKIPLHHPLYLMDLTSGNEKRLLDFPVSSFEWSPDSRQLLYVSAYEDPAHIDPEIQKGLKAPMSAAYLLDLGTGARQRITGFGPYCYGSWSPDGRQLALSFGDAQTSDIYIASVDGKRTRRISDSQGINIKPVWSPDGKKIAFISFIPQAKELRGYACVIDSTGTNKKQISDVNPYEISWSKDGKFLLLRSTDGFTLASLDGNTLVDLNKKVIKPQDAVFTPDGKQVMFRSNHDGPFYLYVVDMNGANIRRFSGHLSASTFCVSPLR